MIQQYFSRLQRVAMVAAATVLLGSCAKNLDQTPVSSADKNAIFGSEAGMKLYTSSFVEVLPTMGDVYRKDAMSDYSAVSAVPDFLRAGAYNQRIADGWDWKPLRNINYFIVNCNNPAIDSTTRNHYIGLARFYRAFFYFEKMKRFGDVPWINKPLDINDKEGLYAGRDKRTLITDSIIADLNYAAEHITLKTDPTASQITKSVVYGFKSRVCLFEGTFRKYQKRYALEATAQGLLQQAADAAKKVIDEGGFSLNQSGGSTASYRQLFISAAPVTNEVMLANVTSSTLAVFNDANWYFTSATYGNRLSFTRTFIKTYLNIDGTPFTNVPGHDTLPFVKETKGRDMRLQQTIRMGGYTRTDNGKVVAAPPVFSYTYTGYMPIKFTLDDTYSDGGSTNTNAITLMRYAEILLNYAEARAELGQLTPDDWAKTVGALRMRAGITGNVNAVPTVLDEYMRANYYDDVTDPALMEIRRERGIELVLEGFRFYDLVRWAHGELLLKPWTGMYVPALDTPMDLNGDGVYDVYFYKTAPAEQVKGITYINVNPVLGGNVNPQVLANDTHGEIHWLDNVDREFPENGRSYLYPIPYTELLLNTNLKQNDKWDF